eukprot:6482343-Prorocentrum_lima.AAC.1
MRIVGSRVLVCGLGILLVRVAVQAGGPELPSAQVPGPGVPHHVADGPSRAARILPGGILSA